MAWTWSSRPDTLSRVDKRNRTPDFGQRGNHTPFKEAGAGDLGLTAAQLVRREKDRKVRAKQPSKKAYAKNAQAMREQYSNESMNDENGLRATIKAIDRLRRYDITETRVIIEKT